MTRPPAPDGSATTREERLAARLRDNLRRRKAQARGLDAATKTAPIAPTDDRSDD